MTTKCLLSIADHAAARALRMSPKSSRQIASFICGQDVRAPEDSLFLCSFIDGIPLETLSKVPPNSLFETRREKVAQAKMPVPLGNILSAVIGKDKPKRPGGKMLAKGGRDRYNTDRF